MPKVKTRRGTVTPVSRPKQTNVKVRDMSRYEEAVDALIQELESLEFEEDVGVDTAASVVDAANGTLGDLRVLADEVRFEFQMMQVERKECVRPTTLV